MPRISQKSSPTPEVLPRLTKGLGEFVAIDRLMKSLKTMREERLGRLKPSFVTMFRAGAVNGGKEFRKTIPIKEGTAGAQVQLRSRNLSREGLSPEEVTILTKERIPLRYVAPRMVINPRYAGDDDDSGVTETISRLVKLVAANPDAGIPPDFFVKLKGYSLPVEDALFRVLSLPAERVSEPLAILAEPVVVKGSVNATAIKKALLSVIRAIEEERDAA